MANNDTAAEFRVACFKRSANFTHEEFVDEDSAQRWAEERIREFDYPVVERLTDGDWYARCLLRSDA